MSEIVFLISMLWGAGMTGLMFYYKERANERTIMGIALLATIKGIAEGKVSATIDNDGNVRIKEKEHATTS